MATSRRRRVAMTKMFWKPIHLVDLKWLDDNVEACLWTLNTEMGQWVRVAKGGKIQAMSVGGSSARWLYELTESRDA